MQWQWCELTAVQLYLYTAKKRWIFDDTMSLRFYISYTLETECMCGMSKESPE